MRLLSFKKVIFGLIAFAVISLTLMAVSGLFLTSREDPAVYFKWLTVIIICVSAFISGKISSLKCENRFVQGIVTGIVIVAVMMILSAVFSKFEGNSVLKIILIPVMSVVGSIIGKGNNAQHSLKSRRAKLIRKYGTQ